MPDSAFTDLEKLGNVKALVAPNAFHYLGLATWRARYPDVPIFAPAQSIARITSKTKLSGIRPLPEAKALTTGDVELVDMPHYKTGEVLVKAKKGSHVVWYVTDALMNLPELPPSFIFRTIFSLTKSGPGLRPNAIAATFMMADKRALYRWLRAE